jgi:hypothetical protein
MPRKRFAHRTLVDAVLLGIVVVLVAGAAIAVITTTSGNDGAAFDAAAVPSATPSEATPAVGEVIPLPSSKSGGLTLIQTDKAPSFSQQEAMQIVHDFGIPVALGGGWLGRLVTVFSRLWPGDIWASGRSWSTMVGGSILPAGGNGRGLRPH